MDCVIVGFGCAADIHIKKFQTCDVRPCAVIETDTGKHESIRRRGFRVCESYDEAFQLTPKFWDVCVPNDKHVEVIRKIISIDPHALILIEKPVCAYEEISELQSALKDFKGKIVVNENYLSSATTQLIKALAEEHIASITSISVEMDKNRTQDFIAGRYIDQKGAFYYEGPHMITIMKDILPECLPTGTITKRYEDLEIPGKTLHRQGLAEISYSVNDISINLFTSMKGDIRHCYPPLNIQHVPVEDTATRYRAASIEGIDFNGEKITVVGIYEPIAGLERSQSAIVILRENTVMQYTAPIADDTMGKHLKAAVDYFDGSSATNPCTVEKGIEVVEFLNVLSPEED